MKVFKKEEYGGNGKVHSFDLTAIKPWGEKKKRFLLISEIQLVDISAPEAGTIIVVMLLKLLHSHFF